MYPCSITDETIVVHLPGKRALLASDHPNFNALREALKRQDWDAVEALADPSTGISDYTNGKIQVKGGQLWVDDLELRGNSMAERLLTMRAEGYDVNPLCRFIENLAQNPRKSSVDETLLFLEDQSLPITPDGHFLAYKAVTSDFKDKYTRKLDNRLGAVVEVPRNTVDDDRDRACSTGLHFASYNYAANVYGSRHSDKLVVLKVNPRDVVSIPSDYNNQKGRCCRYQVVDEITDWAERDYNLVESTEYDECYFEDDSPAETRSMDYEAGYDMGYDDGYYENSYDLDDSDSRQYREGYQRGYAKGVAYRHQEENERTDYEAGYSMGKMNAEDGLEYDDRSDEGCSESWVNGYADGYNDHVNDYDDDDSYNEFNYYSD